MSSDICRRLKNVASDLVLVDESMCSCPVIDYNYSLCMLLQNYTWLVSEFLIGIFSLVLKIRVYRLRFSRCRVWNSWSKTC